MSDDGLSPQTDILHYVEAPDALVKYYLSLSRAAGFVYASAIKQLISQMYRDHDYLLRRKEDKRQTGYDDAKLRDLQALAWLIHAAAVYIPEDIRRTPIPAPPPKPKRKAPPKKKKPLQQ
jgi:hypothetical protein